MRLIPLLPPEPAAREGAVEASAESFWRLFAVWGLGLAGMPVHLDTPLTAPHPQPNPA